MSLYPFLPRRALLAVLCFTASRAVPFSYGCSECGCLLSSDWSAQGYPDLPGFTGSLRYEYNDSDELRSGTRRVDLRPVALPDADERQEETLSRNAWLGLDYVGVHGWAVAAELPQQVRFHRTIAGGDVAPSESRAAGPGDLRIVVRHRQNSLYRSFGFNVGLKLPTGRFDQTFATGPQAGAPLDRGLQLGSGTTDLLLGVSYFRRPTAHLGWFAQLTAQQPLRARAGFLPSANFAANTGLRYLNRTAFTPQLQLNVRWDAREHGAMADTPNSGGVRAFLSPGLSAEIGQRATTFAFVQLPVYRRLNGRQLEPRALVSVGLTWRL